MQEIASPRQRRTVHSGNTVEYIRVQGSVGGGKHDAMAKVKRRCAYASANARVTPWRRVIAAETIAAISYSASNSLPSYPRHFGTAGTLENVHPGNFGVVLPVPVLPPCSGSYRRSGALSHFPMKGTLREKHDLPYAVSQAGQTGTRRLLLGVPAGDRSFTHSPHQSIRKFALETAFF
ncbi:hypothetical protein ALC56_13714 [Trachymyrmex septentrionalis]|uniref:Uncharacterized protein n=1 Tax=Trachymyrmex septentrionalis TaxID=34720 RepID=A0A195EUY2_9HYME|nr:hypothetical protein ALC56_13714 [Trachymyrmex septentrionalis]